MAIMGLGVENVDAPERDKAFHKGCLTPNCYATPDCTTIAYSTGSDIQRSRA